MFQNIQTDNKFLYHYTSSKTVIDHILKDNTLLFNTFRKTNDPKETKSWEFNFHTIEGHRPNHEESVKLWNDVSFEMKDKCNVLCFSKDKKGVGDDHFNDIYLRGFCKPRMWAQYGDNHEGVCLIFDKEQVKNDIVEQFNNASDLYGASVKYKNTSVCDDIFKSPYTLHYSLIRELGVKEYAKWHIHNYNNELFFEKNSDWRDEDEYRYLIVMDSTENQFLDISKSLKGIMFGQDTPEKIQEQIINLAMTKKLCIEFEQIKYSNGSPWFAFKRVCS